MPNPHAIAALTDAAEFFSVLSKKYRAESLRPGGGMYDENARMLAELENRCRDGLKELERNNGLDNRTMAADPAGVGAGGGQNRDVQARILE